MGCGCKERKEIGKRWKHGRRGFLYGAATGLVAFTAFGARSLGQQLAVADSKRAFHVLRILNTLQHWHAYDNGRFATLGELLKSNSFKRLSNASSSAWGAILSKLEDVSEIIPGWDLQLNLVGDTKYSFVLKTSETASYTFTTDEGGIIQTGTPLMVRGGWFGKMLNAAVTFKCTGPNGRPNCCCGNANTPPCCDLSWCCSEHANFGFCFNCGCACCIWCETN